ncbi:ATP-grasp domain-containing protein [Paenibacillus massiliensis]|uniref:ATP-grasp domain-containing protein n=1 Tax=Paenibacillus massiliensis TaxID=225917 RepID=UPI00041104E3|nr:ATP-grasp domain-containing protein [Paenibacillus massiliensis]
MRKHILFVESRESLPGIEFCKQQGWYVTLITADPSFYQPARLELADQVIQVNTFDEQIVVDFISEHHVQHPIHAVISLSDLYVIPATAAARAIGVPTMDPDATKRARNKWATRVICKQHGIPSPKSILAHTLDEALTAAKTINYPCIIKPCDGASSLGVRCVHNEVQLQHAYQEYMANRSLGKGLYAGTNILIEEYLEGNIYSVEAFTYHGTTQILGLTDRQLIGFPKFVEKSGTFPVDTAFQQQSIEIVHECLTKLGIDFGASHTEIVHTTTGPYIIEVNPRMGGGPIHDLIYHATGIDFVNEILKAHMGLTPIFTPSHSKVASASMLYASTQGILSSVRQTQAIVDHPKVKQFEIAKLGSQVQTPESNFDSIGKLVVVGDTELDVRQTIQHLESQLEFVVE